MGAEFKVTSTPQEAKQGLLRSEVSQPDLLESILGMLIERYGAETIAHRLGQHMTPEQQQNIAMGWEVEGIILGKNRVAEHSDDETG